MNGIESIIEQLERQREALDRALSALRDVEGVGAAPKRRGRPPGKKASGKKKRISAEARARIGDATRKRWAAKRAAEKAQTGRAGNKTTGGRRPMSEEGRANIVAANKRMWAAKKSQEAVAGE